MRFTFATAVLSLASVAIAIPTEMGVFARNSVPTCSEGLSIHCCQNAPASSTGLIGSLLDFDCTNIVVQVLLGGILGGESSTCKGGQFACCNISDSPTTPDCDESSNSGGTQGGISILSNDCILQNVSL